ncbi:MAG TPA: hypothetical protein VFB80_21985 [Pirellulaceae bacterium]|nr:hypothetical protein [Pirellulaceae bacterium]
MSPQTPVPKPRRRWLPQFSLGAMFVLVTAAAIGVWYWYQWPYEVRNVTYYPQAVDPFAPTGAKPAGPAQVLQLEVEYVRRVWSRDRQTIRHGPRRVYDGSDVLLHEGGYRNGVKHGRFADYYKGQLQSEAFFSRGQLHGASRRWNNKGQLVEETNYDRGQRHGRYLRSSYAGQREVEGYFDHGAPSGQWQWSPQPSRRGSRPAGSVAGQWQGGRPDGVWVCRNAQGAVCATLEFDRGRLLKSTAGTFDQRLQELLAAGAIHDPEVILRLLNPASAEFDATPLAAAVADLNDALQSQILVDQRHRVSLAPRRAAADSRPASYPVRLSTETTILVPLDERAPIYQYDLALPPSAERPPDPPRVVGLVDVPLTDRFDNLPLIVALEKLLSPYGLACDYRYGVLWIDRADSVRNWKDSTGISQIQPPRGSRLAEMWEQPVPVGVEFVMTPVIDALTYMQDQHAPGLKFDLSGIPIPTSRPLPQRQLRPVTLNVRNISLQHSIGLILDLADCQATLQGETIVVSAEPIP